MKGYQDVILRQYDRPFDQFPQGTVPVAVEVSDRAESLVEFEHPENAIYVFGPEDGSLERVTLQHCHRFITIPARHCTNLAAAVYITLFDRMSKRVRAGMELPPTLNESRGFIHDFVDSEIG
jgi:tRNA(Leu) C34 or U34 (ribose-2'-O)-methylase TrmL